jgi:2-polyprenyl-3-methyl-5-hydroxy-6-metoxy-1,4-benzoquinol methylase
VERHLCLIFSATHLWLKTWQEIIKEVGVNEKDKDALVHLYEDRFAQMGYDVKTVGWNGREDQFLRFKLLCEIGELSGTRICDVGCGFGDMLDYLCGRFSDFTYTGVDISSSLIKKASKLHPNHNFQCLDISENDPKGDFDYFLLSGVLSYRIENNMENTSKILSRLFNLARKGIAVNFLTKYVNFEREHNFHYSPEEMFSLGRSLTKWVKLRHDYPLWEFTLFLYKEAQD